ncbi:hypothetical protein C1H76_0157 [Elsinoe australis]|uniref:Uncharacterized protein n=1 Tax=Elsinoe australis TaxID=40998 RepID=A0A4U7BBZ1_9PEZI|nr:hypothetical protein C1H76_0157 [Elsinoe australis]
MGATTSKCDPAEVTPTVQGASLPPTATTKSISTFVAGHIKAIEDHLASKTHGLSDSEARALDNAIRAKVARDSPALHRKVLDLVIHNNDKLVEEGVALGERIKELNRKLFNKNAELIATRDDLADIKSALCERNREIGVLHGQIHGLKKELIDADNKDLRKQGAINTQNKIISTLTDEIDDLKADNERLTDWQAQLLEMYDRFGPSRKRQRRDAVSNPDSFGYSSGTNISTINNPVTPATTTHTAGPQPPSIPNTRNAGTQATPAFTSRNASTQTPAGAARTDVQGVEESYSDEDTVIADTPDQGVLAHLKNIAGGSQAAPASANTASNAATGQDDYQVASIRFQQRRLLREPSPGSIHSAFHT